MKTSSNCAGESNNENNIPHVLLLTNKQVSELPKAFTNNSAANKKLSKTQLHKIGKSGGPQARLLELSLKNWIVFNGKCTSIVS